MTCKHRWMMLLTIDYERTVWLEEEGPWNIRGCIKCRRVEFQRDTIDEWEILNSIHPISSNPKTENNQMQHYLDRLELFRGAWEDE